MASVALHRNRDFVLLWSGQTLSSLGSQVSLVAYPLLVLAMTGSAAKAGVVGFARSAPIAAFALPAGVLADRVNRKRLMVGCDGVRALALATIPIGLAAGHLPYALVVAVALVDGAGFVVTYSAERGALRRLVPGEQLGEAVARNESRVFAAMLGGPPLGGLLFGIARALPFAVDAVSYAASTAAMLLIRADFQEPRTGAARGGALDGLRWIWRQPFVRAAALLFAGGNPVFTGLTLLIVVLATHHGASPGLVGIMLGLAAAGGFVGAALAPALQRRLRPRQVLVGETCALALAIPLLLLTHAPIAMGLIVAATELITPVTNSIVVGYRVALAPDELQGRVQAASTLIAFSAASLGPLAVGLLLESVGATATIVALFGWTAMLALAAIAAPAFHHPPADVGAGERARSAIAAPAPRGNGRVGARD
jgi:MFS family permease